MLDSDPYAAFSSPVDDSAPAPVAPATVAASPDRAIYGSGGVEDEGNFQQGAAPAKIEQLPDGATDATYDPTTGDITSFRGTDGRLSVNVYGGADHGSLNGKAPADDGDPYAAFSSPVDVAAPAPAAPANDQAQTVSQNLGAGVRNLLGGAGQLANFATSPLRAVLPDALGGNADYEKLADHISDELGLKKTSHIVSAIQRGIASALFTGGAAAPFAGAAGMTGAVAGTLADAPIVNGLIGGTAQGAGAVAQENGATPTEQALIELGMGGLAGVGAAGIPAAGRALGNVASRALEELTASGAQNRASQILQRNMTTPVADAIENIANRPAPTAGTAPTLGEAAGDSGLAGVERGMQNTDMQGIAPAIAERKATNAIARTQAASQSFGNGSSQALQDYAEGQVDDGLRATAAQQAARSGDVEQRLAGSLQSASDARALAENNHAQAIAALGPTADRDATGSAAREAFGNAYQAAKARTSAAYNDPRLLDDEPVQLRPHDYYDMRLPDGPSGGSDLGSFKQEAVSGARSALPDKPQSLLQFVRAHGGIDSADANAGDIRHSGMDSRNSPTLINKDGMPLDTLRELAVEQGFLPEGTDLTTFMDQLDRENRGLGRVVRDSDLNDQAHHENAAETRDFWRRAFDERGLDPFKMTDAQWKNFYQEMRPGSSQSRTLGDIERERPVGSAMGPFQKTIAGLRDNFYGDGGNEAPAYIKSFLNEVMNADTVGIRKLEGWERRSYDLAAQAPDRANASFMQAVGRIIGGKAAAEGGPARQAALQAARAARQKQGRIFETGDTAKAFAKDRYGNPNVGDNTVPGKLVRPGAPGGDTAQGLIDAVGPQQAETVVRQEIRRVAEEKGVQTPAQARALTVQYGEAARRFPAVQRDLQRVQASADALDAARQAETQAARAAPSQADKDSISELSALHAAILKTPMARVANRDVEPTAFVGKLLRQDDGGRQLRVLYNQVKRDDGAASGFRRALGDYVEKAGRGAPVTADGTPIPSVFGTRKAIGEVLTRSGDILTAPQKIVLKQVQRELEQAHFAAMAGKPAGSETFINKSFAELMGHVPLPGVHAGIAKRMLTKVVASLGNGEEVKRLIGQSILDPDFAATLLKRPTPRHLLQVQHGMVGRKISNSMVQLGRPIVSGIPTRVSMGFAAGQVPLAAQESDDKSKRVER